MEPKYICEYKQTKPLLKEFFQYTFYKSRGSLLLYAALILGVGLVIFSWKTTGKPGEGIILVPGVLIVQFFMYVKTVSATYDRSKKSNGGECTQTVELYDDKLVVRTDMGVNQSYDYGKVKSLIESRGIYLLKLVSGSYVVMDKKGFQGGSAAEAAAFLRSKGIKG